MPSTRIPCDACRQRRIRCDGDSPCSSCLRSQLCCRREYVRKRRGRKDGIGKQISALRASQTSDADNDQRHVINYKQGGGGEEEEEEELSELMKRCVDIYLEHMYPVMPLLKRSTLGDWFDRPLAANERSMLFALCALVTTFMCARSETIIGRGAEWESVARLFIRKSLAVRLLEEEYDFNEDDTVLSLLTSFFLAVTYFELHKSRQCWFYLREAITLAQSLGLHTNEFYHGMKEVDALYCCRIHDILFVTERSFAISRHKPVLLSHPVPPRFHEKQQEDGAEMLLNIGFRQLVQVYAQLDPDFLDFWSSSQEDGSRNCFPSPLLGGDCELPDCGFLSNVQKADILVTQHWLDLTFWRAALQQGLLSSMAQSRSRMFSYPEDISLSLLRVLSSLPAESVEVHGLGIFEKIYHVGVNLADFIDCSTRLKGWTETMSRNLDRLNAIQRYLLLTPNSNTEFAVSLRRRLDACYSCYSDLSDMSHAFIAANEEDTL